MTCDKMAPQESQGSGDSNESKKTRIQNVKKLCQKFRDEFPDFDYKIAAGVPEKRKNLSKEELRDIPSSLCNAGEHVLVKLEVRMYRYHILKNFVHHIKYIFTTSQYKL